MTLHEEPYYKSDLWWILYKVFYNAIPKGTYKKEWFYSIPCAFDIETTSLIQNDEKKAFMYIWMLGLNGYCIIGREWDELIWCLDKISEYLALSENVFLPIYVHNLSYEFQFIKDRFEWIKVFALDKRKVNYCRAKNGIEFRCSYQLSGTNLETVGRNLQKYKVKKLSGNLDYKKIRHSKTPLTEKEMAYCIHDVLVVMAYIQECIEHENGLNNIPMTKTGYVRRYVKRRCMGTSKHRNEKYRNIIKTLKLEPNEYLQLRRAFQGGFTHANAMHSGVTVHDVDSFDFTSSYPAVMLSEQFPMSQSELIEIHSKEEFERNIQLYCCLFDARFVNIRSKELFEDYISRSHCSNITGETLNNGRVVEADELTTTITEQDFIIIKRMYKWDSMYISNFRRYKKEYLPKEFVDAILTLYEDKTQLKDVEGKEVEYMQAKANLNSLYGMTVTDIVRDEIFYSNHEWVSESPDLEKAIDKYNKSRSRFLFYPWGVWVTAYARVNLWTGIIAASNDYVYSDTDSLKMLHGEKHMKYIEMYNKMITRKIGNVMRHYDFPINRTKPKTIEGKEKPIGVWDYEGHYINFKTLGAKRYIWLDSKKRMQMTVAGLSKKIGLKYLQFIDDSEGTIFDRFNNNMYIPKGFTGKMLHTYIDNPTSGIVTDYLGNVSTFDELSSIYMEDADYTLSIGAQYAQFLLDIKNVIS
jgi:hypothetical protein